METEIKVDEERLLRTLDPRSTNDHIIPDGVRFIKPRMNGGYAFMLEIEPGVRRVAWSEDRYELEQTARTLAFPYVVLFVQVFGDYERTFGASYRCRAFYRNEPLSAYDDKLMAAVCLNVFQDHMCTGIPYATKFENLGHAALSMKHAFFEKKFNPDGFGSTSWVTFAKSPLDIYPVERWEELSRQDPSFILKQPWPECFRKTHDTAPVISDPQTVRSVFNSCENYNLTVQRMQHLRSFPSA
jgi:hypothetical protein